MKSLISCFVLCAAAVATADAGEFNEVLSIGDAAPTWTNLPGTDGKSHSLADHKDRDVLVVIFTCASCPTAVDYEDRINALVKRHGGDLGKAAIVAVCVNRVPGDTLPDLTARVKERKMAFHFLHDESQKIARDFGAIFTPEFYVFDRQRKLVYMGALDDVTDASKARRNFVDEAIASVLNGEQPTVKETIARGCRVRYARERRSTK